MSDREKILKFPGIGSEEAEAAEWVARLESGTCSADDQAKFQEWLDRSLLNREAASRLFGLWSDFDTLKKFVPPRENATVAGNLRAHMPIRMTAGVSDAPWRILGGIAACMVVGLWAVGFFFLSPRSNPTVTQTYQTAIGDHKTVQLSDGTVLVINTDSKVEVTYSDNRRDVRLLVGEAYFEVVHDDRRPFTVTSGNRMVRDIGTAFDVRLRQNNVEVTVTKGSVELAAAQTDSKLPSRDLGQRLGIVTAGQNAVFDRKIVYLKPVTGTEMNHQLAWRQGVLVYTGEPLEQVIADVSRYTQVKIELDDPRLKDVPVGGYFEIRKLGMVFVALEKNFGIRAEWSDSSHVRLFAAGGKHAGHGLPMPADDPAPADAENK
jgi:transmembrane sensor